MSLGLRGTGGTYGPGGVELGNDTVCFVLCKLGGPHPRRLSAFRHVWYSKKPCRLTPRHIHALAVTFTGRLSECRNDLDDTRE
ncbi:hypothetical protein EYF80_028737 [Liparis tanakae]|uniref:Uncharacterized protein n=1 Tax=Liparis tanakae TaxID=230148 RepID=A0A4Z2H8A1_9TELE|nr:hypothetical protein EYF80_028737 [Liparis tanakae]